MRRVVVTGLGAVTPLAVGILTKSMCPHECSPFPGVRRTWKRLLEGHSGIVFLSDYPTLDPTAQAWTLQNCMVAGLVPQEERSKDGGWKASDWLKRDVSIYCQRYFGGAEC